MRVVTLDLLKIISIFLVIMSHVTLLFLLRDENNVNLYFFRQSGQLGVSLFFMCSGYFLLNNKHENQAGYVIHKVKGILAVLFFWILIYYLYDTYFISKFTEVPDINLLNYINVSKIATEATPLWFIFSIISLYILTPVIRHAFKIVYASEILKMLILMIFISNLTLLNAWTDYSFSFSSVPFNILIPFQAEGLIGFLIGGYLGLTKPEIKQFTLSHLLVLALAVISFITLSVISSRTGITIFYGKFYNILLLISSVCLFLFVVNLNITRLPESITNLSQNILGIYLVHNIFVIEIHNDFIHEYLLSKAGNINIYIYIFTYSLVAFILSYILCVLLKTSKLTSKIVTL